MLAQMSDHARLVFCLTVQDSLVPIVKKSCSRHTSAKTFRVLYHRNVQRITVEIKSPRVTYSLNSSSEKNRRLLACVLIVVGEPVNRIA